MERAIVSREVFGVPRVDHLADVHAFAHGMLCVLAPGATLEKVRTVVARDLLDL